MSFLRPHVEIRILYSLRCSKYCRLIVHRNMLQQQLVADVVEAAFDVTFQRPLCRCPSTKADKQLLDGISRAPFWPEAIGVAICRGLGYGF